MSTPQNNQNNNDWIWLPLVVVLFAVGLWPIALVVLISKVFGSDKKKTARQRHPYDIQKQQQAAGSRTTAGKSATAGASSAKTDRTSAKTAPQKAPKGTAGGKGLIIGGAVLASVFGLGMVGAVSEFISSLMHGYFFSDELSGVILCVLFLLAGLVMLCAGVGRNRRRERYVNYLGYIGTNRQVDLARMAAVFGISVRKLCRDLRTMLSDGVLPKGYLDLSSNRLILTDTGYQAPPPEPEKQAAPPEPEPAQDDNAILQEIRAVNDAIPDPVMSAKIDRIGEITGKILEYQRSNPGKDSQLRSFLNYYLPTTLKILRSYAQLDAQGVAGENITAAKARIEGMMDKVVEGFENQLDKLFRDSAMDISSDVAVLEQMLEKDGLSGQNQGMTLGG